MKYIELYHAEMDYLTLTTWEYEIFTFWLKHDFGKVERKNETVRQQQYIGETRYYEQGSIFVGQGEQKGMPHYIVRISGNMAEIAKEHAFGQRLAYQVECRRLDLQITIDEPKDWSQIALFNRSHRGGKIPGWAASNDSKAGKLETVYIGSWHSDRLATVYVKLTSGNGRLLRFETRYKADRSNALLPQLAKGELPDNFLRHELQNVIKDAKLSAIFERHLLGNVAKSAKVRQKVKEDVTADWLIDKVLPTFARIILDHDHDGRVLMAYQEVMDKVCN